MDEFEDDFELGDKVTATKGYKVVYGIITGISYEPSGTQFFVAGEWYERG